MFTVEEIMNLFLSETIIETLGNWYPRVIAVMSCVIPFTYLLFAMFCVLFLLYSVYRLLAGGGRRD